MNRLPNWKPQLALFVGICGAAAAGVFAPGKYTEPVRTAVVDAVRPGRQAAMLSIKQGKTVVDRLRPPPEDDELVKLKAELAVWQSRTLLESATEIGRVQLASAEAAADVPAELRALTASLLKIDLVPAQILGREPDVLRMRFARILDRGRSSAIAVEDLVLADAPHLDQGADAGIQSDQPVVSGRIVVGAIRQVGQWTSTLQLITDQEYRARVQLVRRSTQGLVLGTTGVLRGTGDGACRIDLVPGKSAVSVGDFVFSRQQDASSTGPLYFGRVTAADTPAGPEDWTIQVAPAFDPAALQRVQVLTVSLNPERIPPVTEPAKVAADDTAKSFQPVTTTPGPRTE